MKLLCAADLHLGRQPSRLPDGLRGSTELSAAAAWWRLVASAKEQEVHAVLLAGDVLDDEHDYFEAYGDLRSGVEELVAAGITVLAVSGNHDVEVLPRLARAVPRLVLLGEGGRWQVHTLDDGETTANVVGWSFPASSVTTSPLTSLATTIAQLPPMTTIGLLHCDRDQSVSTYAPVTSADLAAAGVDLWLLGHVHRPDSGPHSPGTSAPATPASASTRNGSGYLGGYLGSTFAADPGEEGARGAWLAEVGGTGITLQALPLSPLRFETLVVDVSELNDPRAVSQLITDAVTSFHAARRGSHDVVAVGLRLRLTGRSALRPELFKQLRDDDPRDLLLTLDDTSYFVHDMRLEVLPAIDIGAAALGSDPLALIARKLLILDGPPSQELEHLLVQGREQLTRVSSGRHYRDLEPPLLDDEVVRGRLRRAALHLIDLMAER